MGIMNLIPKSTVRYGFRNAFMRTFIFGLVGSLSMYITSWERADRIKDQYFYKGRAHRKNFDFIIGKINSNFQSDQLVKHLYSTNIACV